MDGEHLTDQEMYNFITTMDKNVTLVAVVVKALDKVTESQNQICLSEITVMKRQLNNHSQNIFK
jgi:GTP-binding protein EngB required for normal cell division